MAATTITAPITLAPPRPLEPENTCRLLEASAHHAWQTVRPVEKSAGDRIEAAIEATCVEDAFGVEPVDSMHDLSPPTTSMHRQHELDP
ncbi:hypothetical protein [Nocardia asteroides]|uniref:hypothetical protein n=1 Tax=Nocardia asteroides TaxID=1824 RepID=UPI0034158F15